MQPKLYHGGFRAKVSRNTLAKVNENRDWRIYADFGKILIGIARNLYATDDFGVALKQTAYAFDSTTIDLCLSLFPWAQFRKHKSEIKLHTLIYLRGNIICFIRIVLGQMYDVKALDNLRLEPGAFYVLDRGYVDYGRLYAFNQRKSFFITRTKRNMDCKRRSSSQVNKSTGLRSDQTIVLAGCKASKYYPELFIRITYCDAETSKRFVFLTNKFMMCALTIAQLYKARWRVELFFKWLKKNLRIKAFYNTSRNAVKIQIWIATTVYMLIAIMRKQLALDRSLSKIL